jgi:hypothetical protein
MTPQQKSSRANIVRQRRSSQIPRERVVGRTKPASRPGSRTSSRAYRPESVFLPVEPRPVSRPGFHQGKSSSHRQAQGGAFHQTGKNPRRANARNLGNGYDVAFSLGQTTVHAPELSFPNLGRRWISAGVTLLLVLVLYTMSTSNAFKVNAIELTGNQRLDAAEISAGTGLIGQPIYKAIPSKVEEKLRTAFPDLTKVTVSVGFLNSLRVDVVERTPVLAWYQGDNVNWIDPLGFAFSPRGEVPGLVQIAASGDPPRPLADPKAPVYEQPFVDPALVQAIVTIYPQVPEGAPMVYDPKYGLGWQDPHGWSVYFGRSTNDIEIKKKVYQSIVDTFTQRGIQPTMVSVAYLDAPFYK